MVFVLNYIEASTELKHHRHGRHTAGGVESRETNAHGEDAFSVAGDHVLLARDHEGIIVLEQWQPLTPYYSLYKYIMRQSINPKSRIFQQLRISRQRLAMPKKKPTIHVSRSQAQSQKAGEVLDVGMAALCLGKSEQYSDIPLA